VLTVEFKFEPNQKVQTSLGDTGIIDTCGKGTSPINRYYVVFKGGTGAWVDEDLLTAVG
jgi:hypothetical protein